MPVSKRTTSGGDGSPRKSKPKPRARPDRKPKQRSKGGSKGRSKGDSPTGRKRPRGGLRRRAAAALAATSRAITPARGLLVAAIGCAVLLGLSQFADYRGVAIGLDNYDAAIASVAPAPEVGRAELGTAHSYLFVPAGLVAIAILVIATVTRRWRLCRLAALIGVAAVAVSFAVDRPTGLDEGELSQTFAGAEAQLLGGFWAQVFAGIGLTVTSLLLGAELRRGQRPHTAGSAKPARHGGRAAYQR
jgi:hypothetical protein